MGKHYSIGDDMPMKRRKTPSEIRKSAVKKGKALKMPVSERNRVIREVLEQEGYKLNQKKKSKSAGKYRETTGVVGKQRGDKEQVVGKTRPKRKK